MKKKNILEIRAVTILLAIFCSVLWGSVTPVVKLSYSYFHLSSQDIPALLVFAGVRYFLCGTVGFAVGSLYSKKPLIPRKTSWGNIIKLSLVQTSVQQGLFYIGMTRISGINGSILSSLYIFFSVFIACLLFRQEKLTIRKLFGCCLGFCAILIINLTQGGFSSEISFMGEGLVLLASIAGGASHPMIKEYTREENVLVLNTYQFLVGGATLILAGLCLGGRFHTANLSGYLLFAYMVVMPITAFTIWGQLLKYTPVSQLSVFGFINPITGVLLSSVFLAENTRVSIWQYVLSLFLLSCGIYTVNSISERSNGRGLSSGE